MKYSLLISTILILMLLSCKKKPVYNYDIFGYKGAISGLQMNGKPWLEPASWSQYAFGGIYYSDTCRFTPVGGIAIISFTEDPFIRESFGVSFIPLKVGRYLIKGKVTPCDTLLFAALELYAADGDAGAGLYKRLESVESSITIDSYDKITGNVSGSFDITFVKDYKSAGYFDNYTDTVRFNGGTFKTKWLPK